MKTLIQLNVISAAQGRLNCVLELEIQSLSQIAENEKMGPNICICPKLKDPLLKYAVLEDEYSVVLFPC